MINRIKINSSDNSHNPDSYPARRIDFILRSLFSNSTRLAGIIPLIGCKENLDIIDLTTVVLSILILMKSTGKEFEVKECEGEVNEVILEFNKTNVVLIIPVIMLNLARLIVLYRLNDLYRIENIIVICLFSFLSLLFGLIFNKISSGRFYFLKVREEKKL